MDGQRSKFDGSRRLVTLFLSAAIILTLFSLALAQKKDSCVECHSQLEGPLGEPVQLMKNDIHGARGLSCVNCHGGDAAQDDPMRSMDPKKGFIARPNLKDVPAFCGRCHSNAEFIKGFNPSLRVDQEKEYFTSVHGKLLKTGDRNVATCIMASGLSKIHSLLSSLPMWQTPAPNAMGMQTT
jgi:hypothetical protein